MHKLSLKINIIKSYILLFIGSISLIIFLTFNSFSTPRFNSTGFFNDHYSLLIQFKNVIAAYFFNTFGGGIYILPLVFIFWSYKIFFNQKISYYKLKFILTFVDIIILATLINRLNIYGGGVIGAFFNSLLTNFSFIFYLFWLFFIVITLIVLSITIKDLVIIIDFSIYLVTYIWKKLKKTNTKQTEKFTKISNIEYTEANKKTSFKDLLTPHKSENQIDTDFSEPLKPINNNFDVVIKPKPINPVKEATMVEENIDISSLYTAKPTKTLNSTTKYKLPTDFLDIAPLKNTLSQQEMRVIAQKLEASFQEFGVSGKIVNIKSGPVVTLYEMIIPAGVKTSKVTSLETDIALRMKAFSVRIAVVPGKDVLSIEIPNSIRQTIYLRTILEDKIFTDTKLLLPLILGLDIGGVPMVTDLATMPHLLIAGTTGSGKSVAVNSMILSLIYKLSPQECKMIMIDPKMLELSVYQDIPHLLTPVVTDPKKAVVALKWAVKEMENRYSLMSLMGVRNVSSYNEKIKDTKEIEKIKAKVDNDMDFNHMPYLIVIIDEMADLMLVSGKDIEASVQRLAQMARAAGIHLIMATQRPSVDVITGTIKANFPTRISFQVTSKIDSRTILGEQGAEKLLGKGDMLYMHGAGRIQRAHAPFVKDNEIEIITNLLKSMGEPEYIQSVTEEQDLTFSVAEGESSDNLYEEAINLIRTEGKISTSFLQRKFQIGYNRAAKIIDLLEENGVIGKANATGKRDILI